MKKMQDQQIYEVNPHTMIILPYKAGGSLYSEVMELGSHSISKFTPFELIKTSCKYFGANYDGRRIHETLNNYKKAPTLSGLQRSFYFIFIP
ncbi:competence protein ComK [Listeria aquatica]|uniref:Competence protein ComK n=1 Tax=Listeria aquatica TaxID=1494960 RepID=A0A841ZM66_9LIST|nr:competence protein ComK [Listeria aquatica]MBC1521386.1 competence protein ComK [Listeria aquatica]